MPRISKSNPLVWTSVKLPRELHTAMRVHIARNPGLTVRQLFTDLLRRHLHEAGALGEPSGLS